MAKTEIWRVETGILDTVSCAKSGLKKEQSSFKRFGENTLLRKPCRSSLLIAIPGQLRYRRRLHLRLWICGTRSQWLDKQIIYCIHSQDHGKRAQHTALNQTTCMICVSMDILPLRAQSVFHRYTSERNADLFDSCTLLL